jgi:hypothetical protein
MLVVGQGSQLAIGSGRVGVLAKILAEGGDRWPAAKAASVEAIPSLNFGRFRMDCDRTG